VSSAPIKKLPASPGVGLPGIAVPDRSSEKVNIGFSHFGASSTPWAVYKGGALGGQMADTSVGCIHENS